jgi:hypothetical protein
MTALATLNPVEVRRILWACYDYWKQIELPESERAVCYSWVIDRYRAKFGGAFHQTALGELAKLGHLAKDNSSRGGNRRYYRLTNPAAVAELTVGLN